MPESSAANGGTAPPTGRGAAGTETSKNPGLAGAAASPQPGWRSSRVLVFASRWVVNLIFAGLWSFLSWQTFTRVVTEGSLLGVELLVVNTILVVLFLTRRESVLTTTRPKEWFVTAATVILSFWLAFVQPLYASTNPWLLRASHLVQGFGLFLLAISLGSLGRSFGLVAALRRVKIGGMYTLIRHPLYTSEQLVYTGILLGSPHLLVLAIWVTILAGQVLRARYEENLLSTDEEYRRYLERVKYRFIPYVY